MIWGGLIPPTLFFFLMIYVAIWGVLWLHIFWNICSKTVKYAIKIFRNCIKYINCFLWYGHFNDVISSYPWTRYIFPLFVFSFLSFSYCCSVIAVPHLSPLLTPTPNPLTPTANPSPIIHVPESSIHVPLLAPFLSFPCYNPPLFPLVTFSVFHVFMPVVLFWSLVYFVH